MIPEPEKIYRRYKRGAADRGYTFNLTKQQFELLINKDCAYCGKAPNKYNGVDRVDNSQGYTYENVVPCCSICNLMKRSLTVHGFIQHVRVIAQHTASTQS